MSDLQAGRPASPAGRGFLRRHVALIVTGTVLVTGGAFGYAALASPVYTAHARVLVEPLTLPTAVQRTPDMGTEAAITTSGEVLTVVAARLSRSLETVTDAVSVTVPPNANVLDVAYSADDASGARDGATAVAEAYMAYRVRTTARRVQNQLAAPGVQTRLVTPAARPAAPSSPDVVVDILAGLIVGLVASTALAFAVDRLGRRIRTAARWREITGVPVLAELRHEPFTDERNAATSAVVRAAVVRYLRTRLGPVLPAHAAVLLVVEIHEHPDSSGLAGAVARSFAEVGRPAALIEIEADPGPHPHAGGLRARTSLPSTGERPQRTVSDWVPAAMPELLADIDRLRNAYGLLVVVVPPGAVSGTALDVAAVADTAVLVDHVSVSRRDDAVRTVAELRAVGCGVCGCVLLGLRNSRLRDAIPSDTRLVRATPVPRARPRPGIRPDVNGPATTTFHQAALGRTRTTIVNGRKT